MFILPDEHMTPEIKRNTGRYLTALREIRGCVARERDYNRSTANPVAVKLNSIAARIETTAIATLLVEKGIATWDECYAILAATAEAEHVSLCERLRKDYPLTEPRKEHTDGQHEKESG